MFNIVNSDFRTKNYQLVSGLVDIGRTDQIRAELEDARNPVRSYVTTLATRLKEKYTRPYNSAICQSRCLQDLFSPAYLGWRNTQTARRIKTGVHILNQRKNTLATVQGN